MARKPYDPDNDQDNEAGDDGLRMALSSLSIDFTKRELLALRSYINERLEDCADAGDGGVTVLWSSTDKGGARMDMVIPNATVFTEDDRQRLRDLERTPTNMLGLVGMRELAALREREDVAKASEMRKQKAAEARRRRIKELESFPCRWHRENDELNALLEAEGLAAANRRIHAAEEMAVYFAGGVDASWSVDTRLKTGGVVSKISFTVPGFADDDLRRRVIEAVRKPEPKA